MFVGKGFDTLMKNSEEEQKNEIWRFFIKTGSERHVVFLDDDLYCIREHQYKLNGSWKNWKVCIAEVSEKGCPLCLTTFKARTVGFLTILTIEKLNGNIQKRKMLLPVTSRGANILAYEKERLGGLKYKLFKVYRSGRDSISIGDVWKYIKDIDPQKLTEEEKKVYNYEELFKPSSYEELEMIANQLLGKAPKGNDSNVLQSSDVDFENLF